MEDPTSQKGGLMRFNAIQSYVDSSFFTKLSERKLSEYKLDSTPRQIYGFMTQPKRLNKFNDRPIINLDHNCFDTEYSDELSRPIKGSLHNVNTIEEFKSIDKKQLLKQWGNEILEGICQDGTVSERFHLLTFSDLKKYKFYYWFAFPVLHSSWRVKSSTSEHRFKAIVEQHLDTSESLFFQLVQEDSGNYKTATRASQFTENGTFIYVDTCLNADGTPSIQLKNHLYLLARMGLAQIEIIIHRNDMNSKTLVLELEKNFDESQEPIVTGWERTAQGKLGPKLADLGSLIDPKQLADQAVDLNLKLMKWRVAPQLDLEVIKNQKVLLLGAGTLGSYVSRALMGWGVRTITFVDNGRVSYSNPVRQPLFTFKDCFGDANQGYHKATRASEALMEVFPGVDATGHNMEVPMIGHPVSGEREAEARENYEKLLQLFKDHDVIFLLMDSRESRWLPTLMGVAMDKVVLNAALGFDSYLVSRHSPSDMEDRLGCYYCNDVVAPLDSLSDRTLDQMCTVTRPGGALIASSLAVELLVSMLQHAQRNKAPHNSASKFGEVPHQIRGFLHNFTQTKLSTPAYPHCSACSEPVIDMYRKHGWEFVRNCLNSTDYLEEICGLKQVQEQAEKASAALMEDFDLSDDDFGS